MRKHARKYKIYRYVQKSVERKLLLVIGKKAS